MSIVSALAVYFIIWWTALFVVLPWGIRSQAETGDVTPGSEPGAPSQTRMLRIMLINTLLSCLIFAALVLVWKYRLVTLDSFWFIPDFSK